MPRPPKLNADAVRAALLERPDWTLLTGGEAIQRAFVASNFAAALGFANAVGILAETADHHPDILLHGWNKITITLSTHDQGGLTELDFALAAKIDDVRFPQK